MKALFLLVFIITSNTYGFTAISQDKETIVLNTLVKTLEKNVWDKGHDYIESQIEEFSKNRFNDFLEKEHQFMEEKLYPGDEAIILDCIERINCSVYKIDISSEYYSGYGFDYHFVFFNKETAKVMIKTYSGYNE